MLIVNINNNSPIQIGIRIRNLVTIILIMIVSGSQASFNQEKKWSTILVSSIKIVGDFNGDGTVDIAYHVPTNNVWNVMTSNGINGFNAPWGWSSGQAVNNGVWAGDFNGDGLCDKVSYVNTPGSSQGWWVALTKRNANGTYYFSQETKWSSTLVSSSKIVGDFNGDGMTDIAYHVPTNNVWNVMTSNGINGFNSPLGWSSGVWAGDFNRDGLCDKVSYVNTPGSSQGLWVALTKRNPSGTYNFSQEINWSSTLVSSLVIVGDFNGDSMADIAYHIPTNNIWNVMTSNGINGFTSPWGWSSGQAVNDGVWAGDFNGDGWCDKVSYVNTAGAYQGWLVASSLNENSRQIGMFYTIYYNFEDTSSSNWLWKKINRDPNKTPVAGWGSGSDRTDGIYSSQDPATQRRQIAAMKKCGVDFLIPDLTNGMATVTPVFNNLYGQPVQDGSSTNALNILFQTMNSLGSTERIPIAFFLGFEFWGPSTFCFYSKDWPHFDGWDNQYQRQKNILNSIKTNYVQGYPSLYKTYLGKPLLIAYLDQGLDYPPINNDGTNRPRWYYPDFTVRYCVNWAATFAISRYGKVDYNCNGLGEYFVDGMDTKRYWGWGSGAVDSDPNHTKLLPKNSEAMSIMAGCRMWMVPGDPSLIDRHNGDYYINSWKQVIAAQPKIVLITDWCSWNEEYAIEGCTGSGGWKDPYGNPTYDWYMQITQAYSEIYKNNRLLADTYLRQDGDTRILYWNGSTLKVKPSQTPPPCKPIIQLPQGWLESYGYSKPPLSKQNESDNKNQISNAKQFKVSTFPNPFNSSVTISFTIAEDGLVELNIAESKS
jgi:hypothetical protein